MPQQWAPHHYDEKLGFVSAMARDLIDLLQPQKGERILDVGSGTGDLTHEIAQRGADVVGIDVSPDMVRQARAKYPGLRFLEADAECFRTSEIFDAVFSNAALHWMTHPQRVIASLWAVLRPGGRLVAEFGGRGNVKTLVSALNAALREIGAANIPQPWYFPTLGEYAGLLEAEGFRLTFAVLFDRPTRLPDGEEGLKHWLDGFAGPFLSELSVEERSRVVSRVDELTRPRLFYDGHWVVDYKRLRVMAIKTAE
ncbi:MAG: methyltransferase domain-containing protein [Sulfobacillus sp.]|nr:methyltransferase domain-containing protein [Sulfobacillus sp.]